MVLATGLCAGDNPGFDDPERCIVTVTAHGRRCFLMAHFRMPEDRFYARKFYNLVPEQTQIINLTSHRQKLVGITIFVRLAGHFHSVDAPVARHYEITCTENGPRVTYS